MALLIFLFVIEMLLAVSVYFLLRKLYGNKSLTVLAISASLIALVAGWTVGYGVAANTIMRDFRDKTKVQIQMSRGVALSESEWHQLREKLAGDPEFKYLSHKGSAIHAVPVFVVVLLIMIGLAKKHQARPNKSAPT